MELEGDPDEFIIIALPHSGFNIDDFEMRPARPSTLFDEGDRVDIDSRNFEVLHLPGHSPGSIALREASTGTLFSGGVIYDGPLLDRLDGSDIDRYVASMERLLELPVTIEQGGHEPSFDGTRLRSIAQDNLSRNGR